MGNKKEPHKEKNHDVVVTEELLKTGRERVEAEVSKLRIELKIVGDEREAVGVLKKVKADRAYNDLIEAVTLYRMKESKAYKRLGFP